MKSKLQTIVDDNPVWRDAFKASSLKVGFGLHLTRTMCEFISAVADNVKWDRSKYGSAPAYPDNWVATAGSLVKRGLIVSKPRAEIDDYLDSTRNKDYDFSNWTHWVLTPAGDCVVTLLKLAGLFVEADAAIEKKAKVR